MTPRFIVEPWENFGRPGNTAYFVIDTHRFGLQICEGITRPQAHRLARLLNRRGAWPAASARDRRSSQRVRWGKGAWTCRRCQEPVAANTFHECAARLLARTPSSSHHVTEEAGLMSESQSSLPFKKQDKVVAGVLAAVAAVIGAGLLYGLYRIMPMLVSLAKNTIVFFAELVVLVILILVVAQLWAERDLFIYRWKLFARNLRKALVREDPIGVLDTAIKRFEHRLEQIDEQIAAAIGAKKTQEHGIKQTIARADEEDSLAAAAVKLGKGDREVSQHATAAARWRKAAEGMRPMADLMANMQTSLESARDLAQSTLNDLSNQKEVLAIQLTTAQAGKSAVRSLKSFFGSSSETDMAGLAFDEIERQTNEAEAEIEQFMRVMDPMLKTADLKKQAETMDAMKKFQAFREQRELGPAPGAETLTQSTPVATAVSR